MSVTPRISPCLWLDSQAEEAAEFYTSIFKNSRIVRVTHYGEAGKEIHRKPVGSVLTVDFELDGQPFTALNGGSYFQINEAISLQVICETQEEIDYHWERLSAGGDETAQQCGWLKDRFGVSWQVVPSIVAELISGSDQAANDRAMEALLQMKKLDIAQIKRAYEGAAP